MGNAVNVACCGRMCPKVAGDLERDIFDDPYSCEPAGAIFRETLEDLNEVDRLLLFFCSSSNLAAVRWLFVLGASPDACDTNGTTCLHAACRSGSVAIVRDLIVRGLPLDVADITGWTALHIAAFMGRRGVALELMQNGIDLKSQNSKGMAPSELCSDGWLREAIYSCGTHLESNGKESSSTWRFGRENDLDLVEDLQISSRLRFEPFFVPRVPILRDVVRTPAFQSIGIDIFNQRPGQGLAFLVSTGAVRDFPIELSTFMLENDVSPVQVGEFLGEDFSLSQTLRLEFINSVRLTGTGVVSCLAKVFTRVHIPSDMQKIDRLLEGVAQIWWRQHERLQEYPKHILGDQNTESGELEGLQLMKLLPNYSVLQQLMFSTVLLHWSLYAPLPPSQRITLVRWLEMNAGLGGGDGTEKSGASAAPKRGSPMQHMQCLIYNVINRSFLKQLQIWSADKPASLGKLPTGFHDAAVMGEGSGGQTSKAEGHESWARLVGGAFPSSGNAMGSTVTYSQVRSIHCETTATARSTASPVNSRPNMEPGPPPPLGFSSPSASVAYALSPAGQTDDAHGGPAGADKVWLTLRHSLLLFAKKPRNWAPYAYLHLSQMMIRSADPQTYTITLAAASQTAQSQAGSSVMVPADNARQASGLAAAHSVQPLVHIVFLLPDGRWQAVEVPRLELQLFESSQFEQWVTALGNHCSKESSGVAKANGEKF